ncbi:MAG: phage baseplate protein [Candidatus Phlomobacter fragariae]
MSFLSQVISNHISNTPTQKIGLAGFTAYVWTDKTTQRSATVTDIPLETGVVIADHINPDPVQISIGGVISDAFISFSPENGVIESLNRNIGFIDSYVGNRTQAVWQKINQLNSKAQQMLDLKTQIETKAQGVYNTVTGKKSGNGIAQQFVDTFTGIFEDRKLINVDMGYQVLNDMALESFATSQGNEDRFLHFTLTLKQVRFVTFEQVKVTPVANKSATGMSKTGAAQMSGAKNKGSQTPPSFAFDVWDGAKDIAKNLNSFWGRN